MKTIQEIIANAARTVVESTSCRHPMINVKVVHGIFWCAECGAIAGEDSSPHMSDLSNFGRGPGPLAWARPAKEERQPTVAAALSDAEDRGYQRGYNDALAGEDL
jgi:hypothetical protein